MKKLYFAVIAVFLAGSVTFGQMAGDTESLTPSDANLFVKSREIVKLVKTFNYIVFKTMDEQQRTQFLAERDKFRDKTGIDYLDEKSIRNAGIDTNRPVSFANFEKDNVNSNKGDVMLIFLPVINEKESALKFIELVKKTNADNPEVSIVPVTTVYKNVTVHQVKNDLFIAPANGYLLIGSTADIIRRVLDVRASRNGSLMLDENYKDYLAKGKNKYDLNAFVTRKFIMQLSSPSGSDGNYGLYSMGNFILAQSDQGQSTGSMYDSIDYIAAGVGLDGNKFQMNASVKLTKNNSYVDMLLGFLKTGVQDKSLYVPAADSTLFMSMDLKYLDTLCKGEVEWCTRYNALKDQLKKESGIDVEKDFIPYHTGGINVMALDSRTSGGMGDLLIFVPMTDPGKIEALWSKIKKGMQKKYSKNKKFGEEKIANKKGFWFIDESQMRFFVSFDQRGIYAGNSTGLMKSGINSATVDTAANSGRYGKVINDKTFFLLNIKKNAFLKSLMQMRSQGNADIAKSINRIGEIFIYCEKKEGLISVDLEIEIKEPGNKK